MREVLHRLRTGSSAHGLFPPGHLTAAKSSILRWMIQTARYRKLIAQAFTPAMQRQASRVRSVMDAIDAIADRRACDFVASSAAAADARIAGMLGFDDSNSDEFARLSDAMMEFSSAGPEDFALLEKVDAFSTFEHVCRAMTDRRRRPREDLLDFLQALTRDSAQRRRSTEDDVYRSRCCWSWRQRDHLHDQLGMHALDSLEELDLIRSAPEESRWPSRSASLGFDGARARAPPSRTPRSADAASTAAGASFALPVRESR
jgi:hypothetical protein